MSREILAAMGIGWLSASTAAVAVYAVPMPGPLQVVVVGLTGFAATLYWLNRR